MKYNLSIGENRFEVEIERIENEIAMVNVNGQPFEVQIENYLQSAPGSGVSSSVQAPAPYPAPSDSVKQPTVMPAPDPVTAPPEVSSPHQADTPQVVPVIDPAPGSAAATETTGSSGTASASAGGSTVTAPIPGLILDVKVNVGDSVSAGQTVAIMEAMKMENNIVTNVAGSVKEIKASKGAEVASGDVIMVIGH